MLTKVILLAQCLSKRLRMEEKGDIASAKHQENEKQASNPLPCLGGRLFIIFY